MQNNSETIYINGCKVTLGFSQNPQSMVLPNIENILLNQFPGFKKTSEICEKKTNMV